jgi:hypothetical protein
MQRQNKQLRTFGPSSDACTCGSAVIALLLGAQSKRVDEKATKILGFVVNTKHDGIELLTVMIFVDGQEKIGDCPASA